MKQNLIIGIGTGRCGTTSLSVLLNKQFKTNVTHESEPRLTWNQDLELLKYKLSTIVHRKDAFVGDIGMYYLPYVHEIIDLYPQVRILYLERDKDETVESFMVKTQGRNHWSYHDGSEYQLDARWDPMFPKFDSPSKKEALREYVKHYHNEAQLLIYKYPKHIFKLRTTELSDPLKVQEMLAFLGYEKVQMTFVLTHENANPTTSVTPNQSLIRKLGNIFRS